MPYSKSFYNPRFQRCGRRESVAFSYRLNNAQEIPVIMAKTGQKRLAKIPRIVLNQSASRTPDFSWDPQIFPAFDWVLFGVAKAGDYLLGCQREHVPELLSEI